MYFAVIYSWFSLLAQEALIRNISHLTIISSICFQFLMAATPGSIALPPLGPGLSCSLQPVPLGSPCPLQYLLILGTGFVNFKVSTWAMVHPNFNVCSLLPETKSNTRQEPQPSSNSLNLVSWEFNPNQGPKRTGTQMLSYLLFFPTFFMQIPGPALGERAFFYFSMSYLPPTGEDLS